MNVHIMPKDNQIVLKVSLGARGEVTRVLKVPPSTLVKDVCQQLANRCITIDICFCLHLCLIQCFVCFFQSSCTKS